MVEEEILKRFEHVMHLKAHANGHIERNRE
jgi:hypothetical protein